jgi:glutathione S-transferase
VQCSNATRLRLKAGARKCCRTSMTEQPLPILYSFRRCPYAMRARMAVAVSGVQVELREVVLRDKPPEMIAASPKGTVPVLVLPDGKVIDESLDVMHWALAQNDPEDWLSHHEPDLIATNDGDFKAALDRYKYPHRYGIDDNAPYRSACMEGLELIDAQIAAGGAAFLGGNRPGYTDIALFPFVRQFAATDQDWFDAQPLPRVQAWLTALASSDLFDRIMGRYPRWTAGDVMTLFA